MEEISTAPRLKFADQVVDDALRFASVHRNATAWVEWAQNLPPAKRAIFEAIRANTPVADAGTAPDDDRPPANPNLPSLRALSHELRNMLNGAYAIWDQMGK